MDLGFETQNYIVAYKNGQFLNGIDSNKIKKYMNKFPFSKQHRIWYDTENDLCFSQAQFRNTIAGKDCHFNSDRASFIKGPWGLDYYNTTAAKWEFDRAHGHLYNSEIIFGAHSKIQDNKDKSVLIIAGGPSANIAKWENLEFDQIWSCNQYFLNEKVASHKIDLVTIIGGLFDYQNEERFIDLMKRDNTLVSFEAERGHILTDKKNYEKTATFCKTYPKNSTFFHTRYRAQLGIGLRQVAYATQLGFKNIYFVGIDGRSKTEKNNNLLHAFNGKKPIPNWYKRYGDLFQERHFIVFWDYLEMLSRQFKFNFYNLGEDTEFNILSKLFKSSHPLPQKIREAIK